MKLSESISHLNPCEKGKEYIDQFNSWEEFWILSDRADYMLWFLGHFSDLNTLLTCGSECVELLSHYQIISKSPKTLLNLIKDYPKTKENLDEIKSEFNLIFGYIKDCPFTRSTCHLAEVIWTTGSSRALHSSCLIYYEAFQIIGSNVIRKHYPNPPKELILE